MGLVLCWVVVIVCALDRESIPGTKRITTQPALDDSQTCWNARLPVVSSANFFHNLVSIMTEIKHDEPPGNQDAFQASTSTPTNTIDYRLVVGCTVDASCSVQSPCVPDSRINRLFKISIIRVSVAHNKALVRA